MLVGPVFTRELVTAPRRARLFVQRSVYVGLLLGVMCTAWLILTGTQVIANLGDMARFGGILFQLLAPLQMAIVVFFAALATASAVAHEKDRKTFILLLLTRLSNSELVLGKLCASLLHVVSLLLSGLPVFALILLFGGVSIEQVGRVWLLTLSTAWLAGSLGSIIALWREKTFQTLALTALVLVVWLIGGEALHAGALGSHWGNVATTRWAVWISPARALLAAAQPTADLSRDAWYATDATRYIGGTTVVAVGLNLLAMLLVRVWNPSREVQPQADALTRQEEEAASIWVAPPSQAPLPSADAAPIATADAIAAQGPHGGTQARPLPPIRHRVVWSNPILWRDVRTWAYGRKMIAIRVAYVGLFALVLAGMFRVLHSEQTTSRRSYDEGQEVVSPAAWPMIPFCVVSLVLVNALAVTSITQERDGRCLDLLLVTDLTPHEFLFGKLGGVAWVTKEMIVLPLAVAGFLWWHGTLNLENLAYVVGGLLVLDLFVAMLGIHCGMTYANSRGAIGVSLGTVFFLFLGIATCIVMMISFSGSFQVQLAPFLAFILGGWIGLYVALGIRNPSPAIGLASFLLPFATFYAITSFLMNYTLAVFLVTAVAYSFTTAAMMIPALAEFDFAQGRGEATEG